MTTPDGPANGASSSATEAEEDAIDQPTLQALESMTLDAPGAFSQLVREYLSNSDHLLEQMKTTLTTGDRETLERAAHSLKSAAAMFGARRLSAVAARLEAAVRQQISPESASLVRELEEAQRSATRTLEQRVSTLR